MNIRTKLTEAIHELNLNSVLISEQPYVRNLNMFTIDKESIFRIKTDEIRFTFINYSDLDLDVISVRLIEDNNLNTIRADDLLLSNLSVIDNQNYGSFSNHNNENTSNKIEWIAQNLHTNTNATKKKFKIRVIYLMNNQLKNMNSSLIKYRFQITARWTHTQIESQFFTDKFCLIQDALDADAEITDHKLMKLKLEKYGRPMDYGLEASTSDANISNPVNAYDLSEFEFSQLDLNDLNENEFAFPSRLRDDFKNDFRDELNESNMNRLVDVSNLSNQVKGFNKSNAMNIQCKNDNLNAKLNRCFEQIEIKLNSYDKPFRLNDIERSVLIERIANCELIRKNYHLPVDQLLNKELDYHYFSFNKYFKYTSFCYSNLVDEKLRELIYGFVNRKKVIELLSRLGDCSYMITFSPSILCALILNYLDDKNQLIEIMFLEHNLRNNDLNTYLNDNCEYLKYPVLKNL